MVDPTGFSYVDLAALCRWLLFIFSLGSLEFHSQVGSHNALI
jgi:hypothetical protein